MAPQPAPRSLAPDALRGFALAGLTLVTTADLLDTIAVDNAHRISPVWETVTLTAQGRFVPIFAVLFGFGMTLFLDNAAWRGERPYLLMVRRLAALAVLGLGYAQLHDGDQLLTYAVAGAAVLAGHRLPTAVLTGGGLLATVFATAAGFTALPGLFLLGMAIGRSELLRDPARHRRTIAAATATAVAGTAVLLMAVPAARGDARWEPWAAAAGLLMAMGYAGTLLLILTTGPGQALGRALAPFGRTALTNAVVQVLTLVALHETVLPGLNHPETAALVALTLLAVQLPLSKWWIGRYGQGPLEGAWRRLTYGELPHARPTAFPPFVPADRAAMAHANLTARRMSEHGRSVYVLLS